MYAVTPCSVAGAQGQGTRTDWTLARPGMKGHSTELLHRAHGSKVSRPGQLPQTPPDPGTLVLDRCLHHNMPTIPPLCAGQMQVQGNACLGSGPGLWRRRKSAIPALCIARNLGRTTGNRQNWDSLPRWQNILARPVLVEPLAQSLVQLDKVRRGLASTAVRGYGGY